MLSKRSLFCFLGSVSVLSLASSFAEDQVVKKEFQSELIHKVTADTGSGSTEIKSHDLSKIIVSVVPFRNDTKKHSLDHCDIKIEKDGTRILAQVKSKKKKGFFSKESCSVEMTVWVPKKIDLEINNGSGDVRVDDVGGKLSLRSGSGNFNGRGEFSSVHVDVGSGDVVVQGISGSGMINLGSGNGTFYFSKNTKPSSLAVNLGSGNLVAAFPNTLNVKTKLVIGSGTIKNTLPQSLSSSPVYWVEGTMGSGDLVLKSL